MSDQTTQAKAYLRRDSQVGLIFPGTHTIYELYSLNQVSSRAELKAKLAKVEVIPYEQINGEQLPPFFTRGITKSELIKMLSNPLPEKSRY